MNTSTTATTATTTTSKSTAVDAAFRRLFPYEWGRVFPLHPDPAVEGQDNTHTDTDNLALYNEFVQIFGRYRTARIFGIASASTTTTTTRTPNPSATPFLYGRLKRKSQASSIASQSQSQSSLQAKRQRVESSNANDYNRISSSNNGGMSKPTFQRQPLEYKNISLDRVIGISSSTATTRTSTRTTLDDSKLKQASSTSTNLPSTTQSQTRSSSSASSKLDEVLAQMAGPKKTSTAQKTSDDWDQFKAKSGKQLTDELEKHAQSKDALLVKQDFLSRVDQRTFNIEKDGRDKERAKRGMPG